MSEFLKKVPTIRYQALESIIVSLYLLLSHHILILSLYYKAILTNIKLRSLGDYNTNSVLQALFVNNTFISKTRLKLAKNQANAKQHPEPEVLLF